VAAVRRADGGAAWRRSRSAYSICSKIMGGPYASLTARPQRTPPVGVGVRASRRLGRAHTQQPYDIWIGNPIVALSTRRQVRNDPPRGREP
jgi:hypothetical protein